MTRVSDYDLFDYDYTSYWKSRNYEDQAEKHVFKKIFSSKKGKWFLDIGGSYGRLASTYYNQYTNPIVLDYSLKTLQRNSNILKKQYPHLELIAANAYHMPFKDNSFDGAIMVRVLHHILEPELYFKEVNRILNNDATYIQEFANKVNIKAVLRAIFHLNMGLLSEDPYQQPTKNNFEGTKNGEQTIFVNFHPSYIKKMLQENQFKVIKKYGCSYLRSQKLKRIFGDKILLLKEYILQFLFANTNFPPSIIFESRAQKSQPKSISKRIEDVLVCPKCHGSLKFDRDIAYCKSCDTQYEKKENIWDFRVD